MEFPKPKNITDVRSWFGLINQVSYAFSMTGKMLPFRQLLKPSTPFHWDDDLDNLFEESKLVILSEITEGVRIFDKTRPTCDWSKTGIGFWLFHKSTVIALVLTSSAATQAGKLPWLVVALRTQLSHAMLQSRAKL